MHRNSLTSHPAPPMTAATSAARTQRTVRSIQLPWGLILLVKTFLFIRLNAGEDASTDIPKVVPLNSIMWAGRVSERWAGICGCGRSLSPPTSLASTMP